MYCNNCGSKIDDDAVFCINCGAKVGSSKDNKEEVHNQPRPENQQSYYSNNHERTYDQRQCGVQPKSKIVAGLLNIFIPGVGRMYLGYVGTGIAQLILCCCGIGAIWSFIDGIMMLCGSVRDANGNELE